MEEMVAVNSAVTPIPAMTVRTPRMRPGVRDWKFVAVTGRCERDKGPPDAIFDGTEKLRRRLMF